MPCENWGRKGRVAVINRNQSINNPHKNLHGRTMRHNIDVPHIHVHSCRRGKYSNVVARMTQLSADDRQRFCVGSFNVPVEVWGGGGYGSGGTG